MVITERVCDADRYATFVVSQKRVKQITWHRDHCLALESMT
jgi:hypothetical protein